MRTEEDNFGFFIGVGHALLAEAVAFVAIFAVILGYWFITP